MAARDEMSESAEKQELKGGDRLACNLHYHRWPSDGDGALQILVEEERQLTCRIFKINNEQQQSQNYVLESARDGQLTLLGTPDWFLTSGRQRPIAAYRSRCYLRDCIPAYDHGHGQYLLLVIHGQLMRYASRRGVSTSSRRAA